MVGSIRSAGGKTQEFFRTIVYTDEIEVALPTSGTKRTASDPTTPDAASLDSARQSDPGVSKGDERYYGYGGKRRMEDNDGTLTGLDNDLEQFEGGVGGGFLVTERVSRSSVVASSSQLRRHNGRHGINHHGRGRRDGEEQPFEGGGGRMRDLESLHGVVLNAGGGAGFNAGGLDGTGRQYHTVGTTNSRVDDTPPPLDAFNPRPGAPTCSEYASPAPPRPTLSTSGRTSPPPLIPTRASRPTRTSRSSGPHPTRAPTRFGTFFLSCLGLTRADALPPPSRAVGPSSPPPLNERSESGTAASSSRR